MGKQLQNQNRVQRDASLYLCGPGTVFICPYLCFFGFSHMKCWCDQVWKFLWVRLVVTAGNPAFDFGLRGGTWRQDWWRWGFKCLILTLAQMNNIQFVLKSWKVKDCLMSELFGTSALSPTVLCWLANPHVWKQPWHQRPALWCFMHVTSGYIASETCTTNKIRDHQVWNRCLLTNQFSGK